MRHLVQRKLTLLVTIPHAALVMRIQAADWRRPETLNRYRVVEEVFSRKVMRQQTRDLRLTRAVRKRVRAQDPVVVEALRDPVSSAFRRVVTRTHVCLQ